MPEYFHAEPQRRSRRIQPRTPQELYAVKVVCFTIALPALRMILLIYAIIICKYCIVHSKTILIDHYVKKYGAKVLFGNRLYFDTNASKALINKYLKGEAHG